MSNDPAGPGLRNQTGTRNAFRVGGAALLLVGVVAFGYGLVSVFGSEEMPGGFQIVCFMAGLLVIGFGLMCLNVGFMGVAARYGAGETVPVMKDSAAYLSDGQGILGVGRTGVEPARTESGPYCRDCGVRNDDAARFCDACGSALG